MSRGRATPGALALVLIVACQSGSPRERAETDVPDDVTGARTPVAEAGAAAADQGPEPDRGAVSPELAPVVEFCERNLRRTMSCFDDDQYWDTFVTMYFARAADSPQVDPSEKQRVIGFLKDDIVSLQRDDSFRQNCENMVAQMKLPTEEQMRKVEATYDKSCAEYAAQLGWLIFSEKVFHEPR